jgi:BolA protein
MDMISNADKIKEILQILEPRVLEIIDDTAKHHGHAGYTGGEMTHLTLRIVSSAFAGKTRLAQQRMVMDLLKPLWTTTNLHAVSLETKAPVS